MVVVGWLKYDSRISFACLVLRGKARRIEPGAELVRQISRQVDRECSRLVTLPRRGQRHRRIIRKRRKARSLVHYGRGRLRFVRLCVEAADAEDTGDVPRITGKMVDIEMRRVEPRIVAPQQQPVRAAARQSQRVTRQYVPGDDADTAARRKP